MLPAEKNIIVVGTEHYPVLNRLPAGPVGDATVEPEPGNKYDRNALMVRVGGARAGYLSASRARTYRPMITTRQGVEAYVEGQASGKQLFVRLPRLGPRSIGDVA